MTTILVLFALQTEPLKLHPDNPHYFLFRGKPTILVTSGEHYGAVLNLDFEYGPYLDELAAHGLNHTRTWVGTYREIPGSFGITDNTLAPLPNRYICPWARSDQPGYFDGGNKFDLKKWDEAYFARLKDFLTQASKRGVVVELNIFCPNYDANLWKASPLNSANNVNGVGTCPLNEPYTMKHKDVLEIQDALCRKLVEELKDFDNLFFEICNEPYFGGVTIEWQNHIADTLVAAGCKHLISQNIANHTAKVTKPHPAVSIFNFHYCVPPVAVEQNYGLNKPIGENETGFRGKDDVTYRTEGWEFIIAGGALYNNLDYSFTRKNHAGTFLDYKSPGGGSPALRRQLKILKDFIHGFDFIRMKPHAVQVSPNLRARALAEAGRQYAAYVHAPPGGTFSVRWTGQVEPKHSEEYIFYTLSDDGVRLWVNGKLLVDNWTDHGAKEDKGALALAAGQKAEIKMEYYQNGDRAVAKLFWSSPSQKKEIIPKSAFGEGLKGEYFRDKNLSEPALTRTDAAVNFDWSAKSPVTLETKDLRADVSLDLPAGSYKAEWVNTQTGAIDKSEPFDHAGGERVLASAAFAEDIALRITRR